MQIVEAKIGDIRPYGKNPRKNNKAVDGVAASIKEFGFQQPIVVDAGGVIIAGHTRYKAAIKLGLEAVPVVYAVDLTPEQARAYRLADNKVGEASKWDEPLLMDELDAILNIDMSDFGFDLKYAAMDGGDDFDPTPPAEPRSAVGDLYKLGDHLLICGDCTKQADVDALMRGEKASLLLTDPPYNVAYTGGTADALTIKNDSMSDEAYYKFLSDAFAPVVNVLRPGGVFYIWHAGLNGYTTDAAVASAGLKTRQILMWVKNSLAMGRQDYQWQHEPCLYGDLPDEKSFDRALYGWNEGGAHLWRGGRKQKTVLEFDRPSRSVEHPTMKPLALWSYLIENNTERGAVVYDPFCGSGTTVIACERLGRAARVMEIDPAYCDVIVNRWEVETGRKAERLV